LRRSSRNPFGLRGGNNPNWPVPQVIAALAARAEHLHRLIPAALKIFLNRLIGAVGIPDKDRETLLDDPIDSTHDISV
jgi:hypothetical protein